MMVSGFYRLSVVIRSADAGVSSRTASLHDGHALDKRRRRYLHWRLERRRATARWTRQLHVKRRWAAWTQSWLSRLGATLPQHGQAGGPRARVRGSRKYL